MTWSYLPHTEEERSEMLAAVGVKDVLDLYKYVPENLRLNRPLNINAPISELEITKYLQKLSEKNANLENYACFLGAGAYDHFIPATVDAVLSRSEFYTAYTQYQPEISQGYLQALWEYQTMICQITGMDVSNASMYDGATAAAEAAVLSCEATKRKEILVARSLHPNYRQVLRTYAKDRDYVVKEIGYEDGVTPVSELEKAISKNTAAVLIQSPNFFGSIEDLQKLAEITHGVKALFTAICDPFALAVLEAPGKLGADIAVGEGQSLGLPLAFGGPYIGYMAVTKKLMRKMPGRIVGETVDVNGKRGFVLTLQAREQHIRREKATSNICSNEALCALAVSVYLATVGKEGFAEVAGQSMAKAHYAAEQLAAQGILLAFKAPFFQEFVVKVPGNIAEINEKLYAKKIIGGLDLGQYYPELAEHMLIAVTEKRTKQEIDALVASMGVR